MEEKQKGRKYYLDFMRIIAVLCVIFNHTNEKGYYLYAMTDNIALKYIYYMLSAFIAIGVPIFFMISGSLLLGKEETYKQIFVHRISRILAVIFIFSGLQYIYDFFVGKREDLNLGYFLGHILCGDLVIPYWFLYTYLLFLLLLPFLRMLVKKMHTEHYVYLIVIYLFLDGVIPIVLSVYGLSTERYQLPFFHRAIFWPLMGYFMDNLLSENEYTLKNVFWGTLCSLGALFIIAYMSMRRNLALEEFTDYDKGLYTCSLTVIFTLFVFFIIKYLFKTIHLESRIYQMIEKLGDMTFGIYLMEQPVRENTTKIWGFAEQYVPQIIATIIWIICIFVLTAVLTYFLKKIPGLKKLL